MSKKLKDTLSGILEIQELDMQMIQLMRLKKERKVELGSVNAIKLDLQKKIAVKENQILELKTNIRITEGEIEECSEKIKKFEGQQHTIKKVEEFNALSHEMSHAERERVAKRHKASDLTEQLVAEEELLKELQETIEKTVAGSRALEAEIKESVERINVEGKGLKSTRDKLAKKADEEIFPIYQRLLSNKKDRVIVPIENRCCSGCHIMLTAQDENLVRKGERLVFCEHCSRIHYWPESQMSEVEDESATKRRRRRPAAKV